MVVISLKLNNGKFINFISLENYDRLLIVNKLIDMLLDLYLASIKL
jgi:hypothetical protein